MLRSLLSVSGFTLLSRITGFVRDIIMASVLGRGALSDAFFIAFRLPNHFRAIFAEGAYNASFVPLYSGLGRENAWAFARNILSWQICVQVVLLIVALIAMPWVVMLLAPGISANPAQMALAVELTRITFAYLICITIVTHLGGMLNAEKRFWAAAAAPILLNIAMAAAFLIVFIFPTAAHAAAWGVVAGGVLELLLLVIGASAVKLPILPSRPSLTADVREFFRRFWPATLGAAGVQIALFADTFLASFMGEGSFTSLYYADRVNQLPMGVVAIALGTVLLPEVSRSVTAGNLARAQRSFSRATEMGLLLTLPCLAAFLSFPNAIMEGLFARGNFDIAAAKAAGSVLLAYAAGLPAFVVLRTVTPLFHARGDTQTPVMATGIAIAANLAVKVLLIVGLSFGVEGIALGTAVGTWVNMLCLSGIALARGHVAIEQRLTANVLRMVGATVYAVTVVLLVAAPLRDALTGVTFLRGEVYFVTLGVLTLAAYGVALLALRYKR